MISRGIGSMIMRMTSMGRILAGSLLCAAVLFTSGSMSNVGAQQSQAVPGARRVLPWEKNNGKVGQALYRDNCAVCHELEQAQSTKLGPSFYKVFQQEKMPRGNAAPSRDIFSVLIRFGNQVMPAFRNELTAGEINMLIDYIEDTTRKQ